MAVTLAEGRPNAHRDRGAWRHGDGGRDQPAAAGLRTTVWNRSPQPIADLVARGDTAAGEVGEAFHCDVVLSLLLDDAAVRAVLLDGDILAAAPAGTVHVCMSSISTGLVRDLVRAHQERGLHYVAAAMFGRPEAAAASRLEIVTAGAADLLDRVEPVLSVLGRTWRMDEDPPLASLAKIAGNFLIGCAVQAMAESAALLASRGGGPEPFLAMMGNTLLAAPVYQSFGPAIAHGTSPGMPYGPKVAVNGVERTLGEAQAAGIRMRLAELMQGRLQDAEDQGLGDEDWSVALAKMARARKLDP